MYYLCFTVAMNATLGDLKDQVRDRSSWRKSMGLLGYKRIIHHIKHRLHDTITLQPADTHQ